MTEEVMLPNRMSIEDKSKYFSPHYRKVGIRFDGEVRSDVVEYDKKAGWIKIQFRDERGKLKAERGRFVTITKRGVVEPYWK